MQQNYSDCTGLAQHALVLGPSGHVQSDPTVPTQSGNSAIQPDPTQEPVKPEASCLTPRVRAIKEQGFSEAVQNELRLLNEDQPDPSMRQSGPFLQSGASVIGWTSGHHL